jgi:hypothetical protein
VENEAFRGLRSILTIKESRPGRLTAADYANFDDYNDYFTVCSALCHVENDTATNIRMSAHKEWYNDAIAHGIVFC